VPLEVEVPGFGTIEFPDEMAQDEIKSVLAKKFPPPQQQGPGDLIGPIQQFRDQSLGQPLQITAPPPPSGGIQDVTRGGPPLSLPSAGAAMSSLGETGAQAWEDINTPTVEVIPTLSPEAQTAISAPKGRTLEKVAAGAYQGIAHTANYFTSPMGAMTLGIGMLPKLAQRAIAGAFAWHMARQTPELARQLGEEVGKPPEQRDPQKITELVTTAGFNTWFTAMGGKHALAPGKPQVPGVPAETPETPGGIIEKSLIDNPLYASQNREAAEVHGPVLPPSEQGQQAVPAPEGSAGVQPKAQGVAEEAPVLLSRAELARRDAARRNPVQVDPEVQSVIDAEREAIDTPIEIVPDPLREGDPFATNKKTKKGEPKLGQFMRANRAKRTIEIFPDETNKWLQTLPPERRARAIKARLWEERFHLDINNNMAETYWRYLTPLEKAIERRTYSGIWGEKNARWKGQSDALWGQEAMRRRLQQINKMEVSEIAEAATKERWFLRSLSIFETGVRATRRVWDNKGYSEGVAMLDDVLGKLQVAKAASAGPQQGEDPGAFRKRMTELEKAAERVRQAQALEKRASQPPINAQEQAEVRPKLEQAWKDYFDESQKAGEGDEMPGAYNKAMSKEDLDRGKLEWDVEREPELSKLEGYASYRNRSLGIGLSGRVNEEFIKYGNASRVEAQLNDRMEALLKDKKFEEQAREIQGYNVYKGDLSHHLGIFLNEGDRPPWISKPMAELVESYDPDLLDLMVRRNEIYSGFGSFEKAIQAEEMQFAHKKLADLGLLSERITMEDVLSNLDEEWLPIREEVYEKDPGLAFWIERTRAFQKAKFVPPERMTPEELREAYPDEMPGAYNKARSKKDLERERELNKYREAMKGQASAAGPTGRSEKKTGEPAQEMAFKDLTTKGTPGAEPAVPISAGEAGAMPSLKLHDVREPGPNGKVIEEGAVTKYLNQDVLPAEKRVREPKPGEKPPEPGEFGMKYERPNFRGFANYIRNNVHGMAGATDAQLLSVWEDAVWSHLINASPERITQWRTALAMEKPERKGGMGSRAIGDFGDLDEIAELRAKGKSAVLEKTTRMEAQANELERQAIGLRGEMAGLKDPFDRMEMEGRIEGSEAKAKTLRRRANDLARLAREAGEEALPKRKDRSEATTGSGVARKYRFKLIGAIANKLVAEGSPKAELDRKTITIEDIDFQHKKTVGAWRQFNKVEAASPKILSSVFNDNARVNKRTPVSHTKRLAVMENKETGAVEVVSVYEGPDGFRIVDPDFGIGKERPNVPLSAIMGRLSGGEKKYRVIGSLLLRNPVKNFRQSFKGITEFNDAIGGEAARQERVREYTDIAGERESHELGELDAEIESESRAERESAEEMDAPEGLRPEDIDAEELTPSERKAALEIMKRTGTGPERFAELEAQSKAGELPEVGEIGEGGAAGAGPGSRESKGLMGIGKGAIGESRNKPLQPSEVRKVFEYLSDESRGADSLEEMQVVVRDLESKALRGKLKGADRVVISALQKVAQAKLDANPDWTPDQAKDAAISEFYDGTLMGDRTAFVQDMMEQYGEKTEEAPRGTKVPDSPEKVESGARELTIPEKRKLPSWMIKKRQPTEGYGTGTREEPRREMTPEEQAYVASQPSFKEGKLRATGEFEPGAPEKPYTPTEVGEVPKSLADRNVLVERQKGARELEKWFESKEPGGQEYWPGALNKNWVKYGKAVTKAGKLSAEKLVVDTLSDWVTWYSGWMVDRLRKVDKPGAQEAGEIFNEVISEEKRLYGELSKSHLDAARRAAGGSYGTTSMFKEPVKWTKELGQARRAAKWMSQLKSEFPGTAVANFVYALENTKGANNKPILPVPSFATKLRDMAQDTNREIGKLYQGKGSKFKASGLVQRNLNAYGYDIIRQGPGTPLYDRWVSAVARLNKVPRSSVARFFAKWKQLLDSDMPDFSRIEKVNQDFARKYARTITHLKTASGWQPVLHSNLFNYLESAGRRATHVAAFRTAFPNNRKGRAKFQALKEKLIGTEVEISPAKVDPLTGKKIPAVVEHIPGELNATEADAFKKLVRVLQGTPTDDYSRLGPLAPGKPVPEIARMINQTVGSLMAKAVLTGQMILQPGETLAGSTPVFLGARNYLEGMVKLAKNGEQLYAELEKNGAVNRVIYDWSTDPNAITRSLFRQAGNALSGMSFQTVLNEFQEMAAATTARVVNERIIKGQLSNWEKRMLPQTFKAMGFNEAETQKLMAGTDSALSDQFERKAASFLTSGNKSMAEGSPLGANRLFNSVFRFQSYPMMKMNQFRKVAGAAYDAFFKKGTTEEKLRSAEQLAYFIGGNVLQGALTTAIVTMVYKGLFGAQVALQDEARNEPFQFLLDSFIATMGGPFYLVYRGVRDGNGGGMGEQFARSVFPYAIGREIYDMSKGLGAYRDRDLGERIGKFIEKKVPATRAIRSGMALFGLSQEDAKLQASMEAFYRWQNDEFKDDVKGSPPIIEDNKEFRKHMRRAVEALKRGDREKYAEEVLEGLSIKGKKAKHIADSFRGRKILRSPGGKELNLDQMQRLRDRIGDRAADRLRYWDMMLEAAADYETDQEGGEIMRPYDAGE
jgi:hypothetical protein